MKTDELAIEGLTDDDRNFAGSRFAEVRDESSGEPATASTVSPGLHTFADAGGYTTQFILFSNGASKSLSGTIRFFSQLGQPLDLKLR